MRRIIGATLLAALVAACTGPEVVAKEARAARAQRGEASYYHSRFEGRRMANGERFDGTSDSAAHRTLPFGTRAEVRNLETGKTAVVTIEDRGPFVRGRVIDVSPRTARELGMLEDGIAPVEVRPIGREMP